MAHPLQYTTGRLKEKDLATAELGRQYVMGKQPQQIRGLERETKTVETIYSIYEKCILIELNWSLCCYVFKIST